MALLASSVAADLDFVDEGVQRSVAAALAVRRTGARGEPSQPGAAVAVLMSATVSPNVPRAGDLPSPGSNVGEEPAPFTHVR